jgi:hypothetical protein
MTLALDYKFVSRPNPIRASAKGRGDCVIELLIEVWSLGAPLTLDLLAIRLGDGPPEGQLTTRGLPDPDPDPDPGEWSYAWSGETLTLTPLGPLVAPLVFALPGVVVSEPPGTVPIMITEGSDGRR